MQATCRKDARHASNEGLRGRKLLHAVSEGADRREPGFRVYNHALHARRLRQYRDLGHHQGAPEHITHGRKHARQQIHSYRG